MTGREARELGSVLTCLQGRQTEMRHFRQGTNVVEKEVGGVSSSAREHGDPWEQGDPEHGELGVVLLLW